MIALYPHQIRAIDLTWRTWKLKSTSLLVMPTGSGKTRTVIELFRKCIQAKDDVKILVLLDKVDLLNQTTYLLGNEFPMRVTEVCGTNGTNDLSGQIVVASVDTLISVPVEELPKFNILWIDECHNMNHEKGVYADIIKAVTHDRLKIVGTTATPYRAKGVIYGPGQFFDRIDFKVSMSELIESGHLVRPVCKRPDHQFNVEGLRVTAGEYNEKDLDALALDETKANAQVIDALKHLRAHDRKKTVFACINIDHAEYVKETIGEECAVVHSRQKWEERNANLARFTRGDARYLAFVTVVAEGFDHPPVDGVVLLRPTRSPTRYVQIVGRGIRTHGAKEYCLVLDYGKVIENLGPVDNPIVPDADKPKRGKRESLEKPMKFCPNCLSYIPIAAKECRDCGYIFPTHLGLSKTAFEGEIMAGNPIKRELVSQITFSRHVAKSGNECIIIGYGIVGEVREFFVWGNDWAMRRLEKRMAELGLPLYDNLEANLNHSLEGKEYEVFWEKDGKYTKVIGVRLSEEARAGDSERSPAQAQ